LSDQTNASIPVYRNEGIVPGKVAYLKFDKPRNAR
jgi:hypothetical protein